MPWSSSRPRPNLRQGSARTLASCSDISVFVEDSLFLAHDKPRHLLRLKRFLSFQWAARATQRPHPLELGKAKICPHAAKLRAPSNRFSSLPRIHSATLETPPTIYLVSHRLLNARRGGESSGAWAVSPALTLPLPRLTRARGGRRHNRKGLARPAGAGGVVRHLGAPIAVRLVTLTRARGYSDIPESRPPTLGHAQLVVTPAPSNQRH
jgi:hypothetical protein